MTKLRKVILAGILLAASIVLNRFLSIKTPIVQISFTFIPLILSAMLLGPGWSIFVSGMADLLGALLFPFGAFFPGYTFTAIVTGLIYGLILNKTYKKSGKQFLWRLALACVLVSLICNMGLNTLWVWYTTKNAALVFVPTRIIKELILLPIKILVMEGLHLSFIKTGAYKTLFKNELEQSQEENEVADEKVTETEPLKDEPKEAAEKPKKSKNKKTKNLKDQTNVGGEND